MNFVCADTEDDSVEAMKRGNGFSKKVTQIAARSAEGESFYSPGDVAQFKRWFQQRKERFCYFHNLQYDLGNLFGNELDSLDVTLVGGRMIKAVWGNKIFVDSFNIWPMSAKKLGKAFGLKKLDTSSMATDKEYVFRDVEIIRQAMLFAWQFCQSQGIENLPATLGGLCVKLWQQWGGENCHDSNEESRNALYGGRVELFKTVNESNLVAYTDINSLYPFVMQQKFPAELQEWQSGLPDFGIATVTIKAPKTDIAVLPFRHDDGRILYPYGKFRGTWTVAELAEAEESGYKIEKIHSCFGTNEFVRPYGTFVNKLYRDRLASNSEAEKLFFKLLMNNLYGRLGTTGVIGRSVFQTEKNRFDGIPYGEKVMVNYSMPLSEETNWGHAAYVTAYGRLELLKYMRQIGSGNLIYTDTDSCIFDCQQRVLPFATGSALGEMKLEKMCLTCLSNYCKSEKNPEDNCCSNPVPSDYWHDCATFAPKMYKTGSKYKAKGVPVKFAREYIERGKAEFDLPFKFREAIKFFDRGNKKKLSVWRRVEKFNRANYDRKKLVGGRYYPCKISAV